MPNITHMKKQLFSNKTLDFRRLLLVEPNRLSGKQGPCKSANIHVRVSKAINPIELKNSNHIYTPLDVVENVKRVVLNLPGSLKVTEFKGLHVYSPNDKTNYGSINIPRRCYHSKEPLLA
ncbi:hypothetical protein M3Y97_00856000 [Aphelenchoides bicaudatus]|nr:hypothetical protein M3Y97_00856000 [Aphelenchoides bicaudatus]